MLRSDEEQVFKFSIADTCLDYGAEPVEDAIKSEIFTLIVDIKAELQGKSFLFIRGHNLDGDGKYSKTMAQIVVGGNLQHRENLNTASFAYESSPSSSC